MFKECLKRVTPVPLSSSDEAFLISYLDENHSGLIPYAKFFRILTNQHFIERAVISTNIRNKLF